MSITFKDMDNVQHEVASKSATTGALVTGIIGASLGVLNGGLGNGLLGGNGAVGAERAGLVTADQYYQERIADIKDANATNLATQMQICELRADIASAQTANIYQNRLVDAGFSAIDNRFEVEGVINRLNRELAICEATRNVVRGETYLSPSHLASAYVSPTQVLESYTAREYAPARPFNGGGFNSGCGCGCF